ncbi:MAG TPA: histidine kinase dimerization/phospho-acceptor domain-containing protein, partial [Candidatus Omnitrophota bacterium]|nr:histidine kinase dimerization/phospho-acceptor domain-containing protein [Candidatus Omnitrophota bacterium]
MVDRDRTLVRGTAQIEATVRLIADHSARAIEASDALLRRMADMAEDWDLRDPGEGLRIWSRLVEHIDNSAPVGSAWIVDADGNLVLENWGFPPSRPGNFAHRDYFTAHLVPGAGLFVGDGQIGTATGKQRFTISRAARNPDGSLRAVVVAGVFADQMAGVLDQTAFGPKVVAGLLRGDGKVMVLRPGSDPALLARLSGQSGQVVVDGTDYVVVTRKVAGYSATVVVGVPLAAVLGQWRSRAMLTTGIAIVASVCFGLLIVAGLASARREAAAMTALEEQKRTLEQRVAERTGDLARALEAARTAGQAKDLFLATVSHDLRQPLQAMSLLAGVVSATASDDRARRLADQVAASLTY